MARASGLRRRRTGRSTSRTSWRKVLAKIDELRGSVVDGRCDRARRHGAVEKAAKDAGYDVAVPFTGGRGDATQERTDAESFEVMEPAADGFRNYLRTKLRVPTEELLLDRAQLLGLVRARDDGAGRRPARARRQPRRIERTACSPTASGQLTNDFFVNLLDMGTVVEAGRRQRRRGRSSAPTAATDQEKWRATRTDLVFGSNSAAARDCRRSMPRRPMPGEVRPRLRRRPGPR